MQHIQSTPSSAVFPSMPVSLRVGSLNWVPVFVFAALGSVSWHWSHGPHLCLHAVYCIFELRSRRKSIRQTAAASGEFDPKLGPWSSWHAFMTPLMASKAETKLPPSFRRTIIPTGFYSLRWLCKSWPLVERFSDGEIIELKMIRIISCLTGTEDHMFEFDTCWNTWPS